MHRRLLLRGALSENTNWKTKEFLAELFMQLGRPAEALPVYQELFDKRIPKLCAARPSINTLPTITRMSPCIGSRF
jgi:hypothetical protein